MAAEHCFVEIVCLCQAILLVNTCALFRHIWPLYLDGGLQYVLSACQQFHALLQDVLHGWEHIAFLLQYCQALQQQNAFVLQQLSCDCCYCHK